MKEKKSILDSISSSEIRLLLKILDHRAVIQMNGYSSEVEERLLKKTRTSSLTELLSIMHFELIHSEKTDHQVSQSIHFWLNDHRLRKFQYFTDQAIRILDHHSKKYLYINKANETVSGFPNKVFEEKGLSFSNSRTHPWDLFQLVLITKRVMKVFFTLSEEDKLNSRFSFDLRYKHPEKGYVRIQQHVLPLHISETGQPAIVMILSTDISGLKAGNRINYHFGTWRGDQFQKLVEGKTSAYGNVLTKREEEILRLTSEGFTSNQVADKIGLSPETVRTHHKNIIQKTHSNNMIEVVKIAVMEGWI